LEDDITGYKTVGTKDMLDHLKSIWCYLDTGSIKEMKQDYYEEWDSDTHITKFILHLNQAQNTLQLDCVIISNTDKKQHFMLQMYASIFFDKR